MTKNPAPGRHPGAGFCFAEDGEQMGRKKMPVTEKRTSQVYLMLRPTEDGRLTEVLLGQLKVGGPFKSRSSILREAFLSALEGRRPRWKEQSDQ